MALETQVHLIITNPTAMVEQWTVAEAAVHIGIDESTLRRWIKSNKTWQKACYRIGTILYLAPHLIADVQRELSRESFPDAWN